MMKPWVLVLVGAVLALAGVAAIASQVLSGAQPWGPMLSDNMIFAKAIPFVLGLGVAVGTAASLVVRGSEPERRMSDGAIRRFRPFTVGLHWVATVGFLLALVSGSWQYLKGVLDVESPVYMPYVYRTHYIGALLLLFALGGSLAYWLVGSITGLLPPPGQKIRHIRGLAHELPRPLGGFLAMFLGLDMRREPPPTEQFTYYETTVSFPTWIALLVLVSVTGLLKAMRYVYPIPGELLWWASALHVASLVLLAAKLLDHLRYVLASSRWPLFTSMFSTWISERYVRARHPGWYASMTGEPAATAASHEAVPGSAAPPAAPAVGSTGGGG